MLLNLSVFLSKFIVVDPDNSDGVSGKRCLPSGELLFTQEDLAKYNGDKSGSKIYLAFLGIVYDVSGGSKHYGPGGAYAFFSGKDATRAFVTGQFDNDGLVDDVNGLSVDSFSSVRQWEDFYEKDYKRVGRVIGAYYDKLGCPTSSIDYVKTMYRKLEEEEAKALEDTDQFPHCNSEFHAETNYHRVWCSDMSGGTKRNWIGVPRQLYLPREKVHRCACVKDKGSPTVPAIDYADDDDEMIPDQETVEQEAIITSTKLEETEQDVGDLKHPRIKEYPNCDPNSHECVLSSPL